MMFYLISFLSYYNFCDFFILLGVKSRRNLKRLAGSGGVAERWEEKPIFEIGQNGCNFLYQNINGKLIFDVCVVRGALWGGRGGQGRARRGCQNNKNVVIIHGKSLEVHLTILPSPGKSLGV